MTLWEKEGAGGGASPRQQGRRVLVIVRMERKGGSLTKVTLEKKRVWNKGLARHEQGGEKKRRYWGSGFLFAKGNRRMRTSSRGIKKKRKVQGFDLLEYEKNKD